METQTKINKETWAISILSDAQEEISMGNGNCASDLINDAKRVLMGKYTEQEDGMSISIIRGRIKLQSLGAELK